MASKPPQNHKKPTSNNPWDVPPPLPKGDDSAEILLQSVGQALSAWEGLEMHLGHLFGVLCDSPSAAAERAYGAVVGHGTRRDMLLAAAEVFCLRHKQDQRPIAKFLDEVKKLSTRRNEIAHGMAMQHHEDLSAGYYLTAPIYNTGKIILDGYVSKYQYTSAQIFLMSNHFRDYRIKLFHLTNDLIASREALLQKQRERLAQHLQSASPSHHEPNPQQPEHQPPASEALPQSEK